MYLLNNEIEILSSNENKVILTNQRIHMEDKEWGRSYNITLFLEDISSIEVKYSSLIIALIIAIFAGLIGLMNSANSQNSNGGPNFQVISFIASAFFLIIYFISRTHIVSITSNGGKSLNFKVKGMKDDMIEDFIYKVQQAKSQRIEQLNKQLP